MEARRRQLRRPKREQKGMASGTPKSAPRSQEVIIVAWVEAREVGERWMREKCVRKEGSTIMPPMKPTE